VPTEQEVTSFLDECCDVARSAVETRLAATRSAAASSLGMDEYGLDKKFASNCINARIKTLQDQARQANQQMQGIQQEAESAVQSGMASAAGAAAAADALRAEEALVQLKLEDEVSRLRMQVKFLDAVPQQVAGFVGAGGGAAQRSDAPGHRESFAFTVHGRGVDAQLKSGGGVVGTSEDDLRPGSKNRANLVALFRMLHAHVVQQDVAGGSSIASSAPCPRSIPELVSVAEADDTVLHALIRALMGGHADEPLVPGQRTSSKAHKELLAPFTVSEMIRKYNDPRKFDFVPGMVAHAHADSTGSAFQEILKTLGISAARMSAVRRDINDMDAEILGGGRLKFSAHSIYFLRFDNLGFKRGGNNAGYFQTVTLHWEEVTMTDLVELLGCETVRHVEATRDVMGRIIVADGAVRQGAMKDTLVPRAYMPRFWARKNRAEVVTVESLQPSAAAWEACDRRLNQELQAAIDVAVCIHRQQVDGEDGEDPPDVCSAKEFYGLGVEQEVWIHP